MNKCRTFATADQVKAVVEIAKKNLKERKKGKDPSYWKGIDDLEKEIERWLSN